VAKVETELIGVAGEVEDKPKQSKGTLKLGAEMFDS
jgi:hypothetical protein